MPAVTAFSIARRFLGLEEAAGAASNPQVLAMLRLDAKWPSSDDVPWCSAFVNYIAWLLDLPRSKSLAARSWLAVGTTVLPTEAEVGSDVVILKRGSGEQPGPEVIGAPGHVGFFAGWVYDLSSPKGAHIRVLGGNQSDSVSIASFPAARILGVRRLA